MTGTVQTVGSAPPGAVAAEPLAEEVDRYEAVEQYSLAKILGVWAAAAVPMGVLAWVVAPLLRDQLGGRDPLARSALDLPHRGAHLAVRAGPDPRQAGARRTPMVARARRPVAAAAAGSEDRTRRRKGLVVGAPLRRPRRRLALAAAPPIPGPRRDLGDFLGSDRAEDFFSGAWGWFAVVVALAVFNTVLGEELLFRGLLLPRMRAVFGRRDWVANGALFTLYHLHMPWSMPATLVEGIFLKAYPSRRFQSAWMGIIVHSAQSVFVIAVVLAPRAVAMDGTMADQGRRGPSPSGHRARRPLRRLRRRGGPAGGSRWSWREASWRSSRSARSSLGAYGLWLHTTQRSDSYLMTSSERFSTGSYALATRTLHISSDVPSFLYGRDWLGDVRIRGESADPTRPLFIGIARKADVDRYLAGVAHAEVVDVNANPLGTTLPAEVPRPARRQARDSSRPRDVLGCPRRGAGQPVAHLERQAGTLGGRRHAARRLARGLRRPRRGRQAAGPPVGIDQPARARAAHPGRRGRADLLRHARATCSGSHRPGCWDRPPGRQLTGC